MVTSSITFEGKPLSYNHLKANHLVKEDEKACNVPLTGAQKCGAIQI